MEYYGWLFLKLLIGFVITILHLNFSGKTQISQMNAIDLIGNFILGGLIGGVLYSDSISFRTYIISLLLGIALINLMNWMVKKLPLLRAFAIGDPITLIKNGEFCVAAINDKKNKIDLHAIAASLRVLGHFSFSSIQFLQIEPSGQLSVLEKEDQKPKPSVILMVQGVVAVNGLKTIEKDHDWLDQQVKRLSISSYDEVYMIEYFKHALTVVFTNGKTTRLELA